MVYRVQSRTLSRRHLESQALAVCIATSACGARSGVLDNGSGDVCVPRPDRQEVCNGVDDDCDGETDEGLPVVELGAPTVVRENFGTTGTCSTCSWALDPHIWASRDGLLSVWRLSFDGQNPASNLYARRLKPNGTPDGDPFLLLDATVAGARIAPQNDRTLVAGCRRQGSFDRPFSAFAQLDGKTSTLSARTPAESECNAVIDIDAVWTGTRFIVAWSDRSAPFGVDVDVVDGDGRTALTHHLGRAGGVPLRLSLGHGAVLLASELQKATPGSTLSFQRIALDGALLGEPTLIDVASSVTAVDVYSVDRGWIARAFGPNDPPIRIELGPDGTSPAHSGQPSDVPAQAFVSFQRPSGGFVLVQSYATQEQSSARIEWRRGDESLEASWTAPPGEGLGSPAVGLYGGRTYLVYQRPPKDFEPNQIVLRRFGCSP